MVEMKKNAHVRQYFVSTLNVMSIVIMNKSQWLEAKIKHNSQPLPSSHVITDGTVSVPPNGGSIVGGWVQMEQTGLLVAWRTDISSFISASVAF